MCWSTPRGDSSRPNTANHVFTLKQNGAWLDTQGDIGDLATNEQIRSVRFLGNRGYVVTFRQVDPLFVVDLSNQAKPNVLAALKILALGLGDRQ